MVFSFHSLYLLVLFLSLTLSVLLSTSHIEPFSLANEPMKWATRCPLPEWIE